MGADKPKGGFRNVIILSIVSFLNDLSSEMIMPILPMFQLIFQNQVVYQKMNSF